ncbi:MAG: SDR family oxidoreductase [Acidobacteria bacterium]|nr:SDR family oxidoreductase [Acidobacteriota bacterium]
MKDHQPTENNKTPKLPGCYICRNPLAGIHHFYRRMCPACGEFNLSKRNQRADLQGRIALVTGVRVGIGRQVALKLLRDGATVYGTTRFTRNAAQQFALEPDFQEWSPRLRILRADFRVLSSLEWLLLKLFEATPHLDILINNAAQTVRRDPEQYRPLLKLECLPNSDLPPEIQKVLTVEKMTGHPNHLVYQIEHPTGMTSVPNSMFGPLVSANSGLVSILQLYEKMDSETKIPELLDKSEFPEQGLDLRSRNSWQLLDHQVSVVELVEVFLINAMAPFLLCSRLKPLLKASPAKARYIVNVTSVEGNFSHPKKRAQHPHTNMAKAALNMFTKTCAKEYASRDILMNAVDPGWVSFQQPLQRAMEMQERDLGPSLDGVDAAARICDPIYTFELTGEKIKGKFLKDYKEHPW